MMNSKNQYKKLIALTQFEIDKDPKREYEKCVK